MLILSEETLADEITAFRKSAGRKLDVLGSGHVICRPTRRKAEEYLHYLVEENGVWAVADTEVVPGLVELEVAVPHLSPAVR